MSQKSKNDSKGKPGERIYYVENADGNDFTFYLNVKEHESHLLPPEEVSSQAGQGKSQKKSFSYSKKLDVVKIPPLLTRSDLKKGGEVLLEQLKRAADHKSKSDWSKLIEKFSPKLRAEIKKNNQQKEKDALLKKILKELNEMLMTEDMSTLLNDQKNYFNEEEQRVIPNFSDQGQKTYRNRKKFNKHFQKAIKPLSAISGRALICRSYRDKLLSVSFREKSAKSSYKPDSLVSSKYPLSIKNYCDELYETIFKFEEDKVSTKRGLLIIAGATNSSKSEIATGLIYKYLEEQKKGSKRRPHLVTFEDPIEKLYARRGGSKASIFSVEMPAAMIHGIDYTPREKGTTSEEDKDVESLKEALEDALRQTPTVLFVGETREKKDWRLLIDFAGTGHLIVTTSHAGSLTEAMHKIFEALSVKTPAERSEIANRLLGIVHIKRHTTTDILVPAIWRRTPTGKNALTAEGLSSLLPYRPEKAEDIAKKGCLGRTWFVEKFIKGKPKLQSILKEAIAWDLEGV